MLRTIAATLATVASNPLFLAENGVGFVERTMAHLSAEPNVDKAMAEMASSDNFWPDPDSWLARYRPYNVANGVLQIPVDGLLINKFSFCVPGWMTGYEYIQRAFDRGMADGNVKGIAFIVDSPGGMVSGNFELVDHIFENRGEKPIRAFASDAAYSAAYNIASASDRIVVTRSGGVGSVGVLTMHADFSGSLERMGIKITLVYAGKHKVDGNPYEGLSAQAKARMESRVDKLYGEFVATVARNRDMSEEEVRATEALTYDAQDALDVGFADAIGQTDAEVLGFARELEAGDDVMATDADVTNARNEGHETGKKEGMAAGQRAERERMSAILNSPEGKDRPVAARAALETSMSADEAIRFMASLPKETAPQAEQPQGQQQTEQQPQGQQQTEQQQTEQKPKASAGGHFDKAMGSGPQVGSGDGGRGGGNEEANAADTILKDFGSFTGFSQKKQAA